MRPSITIVVACVLGTCGCEKSQTPGLVTSFKHLLARDAVQRGERSLASGDEAAATAAFKKAVAYDGHDAQAQAALGRICTRAGRMESAVQHYQAAVRNAPESAEYALALAESLRRLAETSIRRPEALQAAVRAYRHVRWLDPENADAGLGLGVCYHQLGQFAEAMVVLRETESLAPSAPGVRIELGSLAEDRSDYDTALAEYSQALKLHPENLAAHNGAGRVSMKIARQTRSSNPLAYARAMAHFRKSLELDANQPQVRQWLAELHEGQASSVSSGMDWPDRGP
jgi:Tfp pilus assembly protein PilF